MSFCLNQRVKIGQECEPFVLICMKILTGVQCFEVYLSHCITIIMLAGSVCDIESVIICLYLD